MILHGILQYNTLYVGGRPGTRRFRFDGIIRYLVAQDTVLSHDEISKMHNDMFEITTSTTIGMVNYCTNYSVAGQECQLGDNTDFRLVSSTVTVIVKLCTMYTRHECCIQIMHK